MSYAVPSVDMSQFGVGQTGSVDLTATLAKIAYNQAAAASGKPAHIRIFNESGSTLHAWDDSGLIDDYIPAGGWPTYELDATTSKVNFKVISLLANPPVQLLLCTIYAMGESVPDTPQLGNSPIGGQQSQVASSSLSNEGSPRGLLVIDLGDTVGSQLVKIFNDGSFSWSADVSGVVKLVIQILTTGIFQVASQIDNENPDVTANPPTGTGSVIVNEFIIGKWKVVRVRFSNMQNTSASQFTLALPTAFTNSGIFISGDISNTELLLSGTPVNLNVVSSLAAGNNSTVSTETVIWRNNFGSLDSASGFDTLRFQSSNASAHKGEMWIFGG